MILLSAMQSGTTDNLMNELRLSLGVARRTLQRWRHLWREIFVGTPFWNLSPEHQSHCFYFRNRHIADSQISKKRSSKSSDLELYV